MKRLLLAGVIALTVTVMPRAAFADDVPTATAPPAPTVAPVAAPSVAPVATPTVASPAIHTTTTTGATVPAPAKPSAPVVTAAPVPVVTAAAPASVVTAAAVPVVTAAAVPAVTAAAPAQAMAAAPAAPAATAADGTPLAMHPAPAKPLALAPQSEGLGLGYKLLAVLAIAGGVALYLRKKRGLKIAGVVPSKIDILARAGIGVRSQLVVVEVEGTRLLVGMTPSAIQTLAVLQTPEDDNVVAEARASAIEDRLEQERELRPANLGDRVRSLLGTDEPVAPRLAAVKASAAASKAKSRNATPRASGGRKQTDVPRESREVAGQARGLLLSVDEDT